MKKYEDPLARSLQTKDLVRKLRIEIILNKYKPGSRLIESKIAEQMGVSRAPVRASLQLLAQEGLVIHLSNGGTKVVGFTTKHATDLFDLRLILEKRALEIVIASQVFNYKPLFDFMEGIERFKHNIQVAAPPTSADTSEFDLQFHRSLMMMAANNPLLTAWNTMANIFQTLLEITNMTHPSFQAFYDDHKALAELIVQKNPSCIDNLIEHITKAKEIILERMDSLVIQ